MGEYKGGVVWGKKGPLTWAIVSFTGRGKGAEGQGEFEQVGVTR